MKVKRRKNGEVIDVEVHGDTFIDEQGRCFYYDEVDIIDEPDRQQTRIQFVGQIASAIMGNYQFYAEGIAEECERSGKSRPEMVAQMSLEIADALIEGLEKGGEQ